jgi:hypothetical protein
MLATRPRRPQAVRQKPQRRLRNGRLFVTIAIVLLLAAMFFLAKPVGADPVPANASAAATGVRAAGGSGGGSLPPTSSTEHWQRTIARALLYSPLVLGPRPICCDSRPTGS